jgi:hypothetical protein
MWHAWERRVYKVLVGKPKGKTPLGRPRSKWEEEIRLGFRETGWGGVEWIQLAQDRGPVAGFCKYGDEPSGYGATEFVS